MYAFCFSPHARKKRRRRRRGLVPCSGWVFSQTLHFFAPAALINVHRGQFHVVGAGGFFSSRAAGALLADLEAGVGGDGAAASVLALAPGGEGEVALSSCLGSRGRLRPAGTGRCPS